MAQFQGHIAMTATSPSRIIKAMREDVDFKGIGKASMDFVDLLKGLITPLDKQCASFRAILQMPVMKLAEETIIVDGREELRGQKAVIDTVALLVARRESAKVQQRQQELDARKQKLTRSIVDQGVHLRMQHPVSRNTQNAKRYCDPK